MKISVTEINELETRLDAHYSNLFGAYQIDEEFYELEFAKRLDIPIEFKSEGIILPTARDMVDTFVDNISISNARVKVPQIGTGLKARERAEMMRKIY
jgi:hypothetical protein